MPMVHITYHATYNPWCEKQRMGGGTGWIVRYGDEPFVIRDPCGVEGEEHKTGIMDKNEFFFRMENEEEFKKSVLSWKIL